MLRSLTFRHHKIQPPYVSYPDIFSSPYVSSLKCGVRFILKRHTVIESVIFMSLILIAQTFGSLFFQIYYKH
jgi:hypothetical protein